MLVMMMLSELEVICVTGAVKLGTREVLPPGVQSAQYVPRKLQFQKISTQWVYVRTIVEKWSVAI